MSDRERFEASQEALTQAPTRQGPTAERYESALSRYIAAVGGSRQHSTPADRSLRDELYWNIENNLVSDVMTRDVASVHEDTSFKDVVATLEMNRVSALPVIDDQGKVLGIVSESDLLAKVVAGAQPKPRIRGDRSTRVQTRRKSQAEIARELMHSPAVTIRPEVSVVDAARTAALAHVRRLPVVDRDGVLVGIVTRSDLLRVFLRDDEALRRHLQEIFAAQWCIDTSTVEITVHDGVITLSGEVERRTLIEPLVTAVRSTAGVVAVHDNLSYRHDDRYIPSPGGLY
ncbi:MAG TPA: CBS domain-containing protein [Jatrophihabitantaceae bacterium]|jgi:CBS domain-containing protein